MTSEPPRNNGTGQRPIPNGPAAAAILSSCVGCLVIGLLTVGAVISEGLKEVLNLYPPAGPLSGKTTIGVMAWLGLWWLLHRQWRRRDVGLGSVFGWSCGILAVGLVPTFPPVFERLGAH